MKIGNTHFVGLLLFLCCLFSTEISNAQLVKPKYKSNDVSPYGAVETSWYNIYWFYDLNIGTRLLGSTSTDAQLGAGLNINGGIGYFFNERFGLKGRIDHHRFKFTPGIQDESTAKGGAVSLSGEVLTNVLAWGNNNKFSRLRLTLHGGLGLTSYANSSFKDFREENNITFDDPAIKGNDDMGHIILGLTPQYHINGRCSINLDISTFFLVKQDFTFDRYNLEKQKGIGNISTISLGITFRP